MKIKLRKAISNDSQLTLAWRNHPITRRYSHDTNLINLDEHIKWFENTIKSTSHCLLIAETEQKTPVGVLRYDFTQNEAIFSYSF